MVQLFRHFNGTRVHSIEEFPKLEYPKKFNMIFNKTQLPVAIAMYNYPSILFDGTSIDGESLSLLLLVGKGKLFIGNGVEVNDKYHCGAIIT